MFQSMKELIITTNIDNKENTLYAEKWFYDWVTNKFIVKYTVYLYRLHKEFDEHIGKLIKYKYIEAKQKKVLCNSFFYDSWI